jgi:TonB family protein
MFRVTGLLAFILGACLPTFAAHANHRQLTIAFLDFGNSATGHQVADHLARAFIAEKQTGTGFQVIDRDRARAAALGAGYQGSLNMSLEEARDLASAIGCDFFFTGEAQILHRSPLEGPAYFESYAAIYLVSGRTGKLALWERRSAQRASSGAAESALREELKGKEVIDRYQRQIRRVQEDESAERAAAIETPAPVIDVMSDDADVSGDVRAPRPFRRLKPPYPEAAARAEVEAIVDALVDIDARGEVGRVEIARWAGYGLDQSVIETVRQLHFFPAHRDGVAIPMRVLLRYNFRKPPVQNRSQ